MKYRQRPLSALGIIQTGSTPLTSEDKNWSGDIPFVTPAELDASLPIMSSPRTLSTAGASQCRLLQKDAVLVCCIGSLGKIGIAGRAVVTNQQINSIEFDQTKIYPKFGYYACKMLKPKLQLMAPATTIAIVNKSKFGQLEIPVPPISEQLRIAAILDQADALRAKRREALAQLDSLTQSIFVEMFGGGTDGDQNTKTVQLGDYLTFLTSGGRGWAKYYANTGSRFVRSLDVQMNHISEADAVFVEAPSNAEAKRTEVKSGDVLLTITGSLIGRVATAPDSLEGAYISQHVAILRVKRDLLDPYFLSHYLSLASGGQRQIAKAQYGQTKPGLNFEQIRGFRIPIPSLQHQQLFIHRVRAIESIQATQNASEMEFESLFASLQHRAFRGEL